MIQVTVPGRAKRSVFLNPHLIEYIEQVGSDRTALILTTGKRFVVTENPFDIRNLIIEYRQQIAARAFQGRK